MEFDRWFSQQGKEEQPATLEFVGTEAPVLEQTKLQWPQASFETHNDCGQITTTIALDDVESYWSWPISDAAITKSGMEEVWMWAEEMNCDEVEVDSKAATKSVLGYEEFYMVKGKRYETYHEASLAAAPGYSILCYFNCR